MSTPVITCVSFSGGPVEVWPVYDPKLAEVLEGTEEVISVGQQWAGGSEKLAVPQRRP